MRVTIRQTVALGLALSVTIASLLSASPALAWGHQAHDAIDRAAIAALPEDGPTFLRGQADFIATMSTIPDEWRSTSEPFGKLEEDPNHGWFRESFAFMKTVPRSRWEFLLALHDENRRLARTDPAAAAHINVREAGVLAYAAIEQYDHLVTDMRLLRKARAEGLTTQVTYLERICAEDALRLGHYIGDGSQPLHITVNHNGWLGPNPHGYSTDSEVHARFETDLVKAMKLNADDVRRDMAPLAHQSGDTFELILAYLNQSGDRMERVYQLDKRGAFKDGNDAEARALLHERVGAGASMLRDLLARAWSEAATTPPKPARDPFGPGHPAFNPETGSAPAPR
ncbi:phospholipase C/P1 nuclease family protein [Novosphingobium terrae]|uniref:nuclease n=1 Tax=Novosphingobium terrae TaxID=2726189 RepID=UPI001981983C|nr:nuclease [Novosphingobium terrae]